MTAYEWRISDWSADVCSSDLDLHDLRDDPGDPVPVAGTAERGAPDVAREAAGVAAADPGAADDHCRHLLDLRRPDRKSVMSGKSVTVRGSHGGCRHINKIKTTYSDKHSCIV